VELSEESCLPTSAFLRYSRFASDSVYSDHWHLPKRKVCVYTIETHHAQELANEELTLFIRSLSHAI